MHLEMRARGNETDKIPLTGQDYMYHESLAIFPFATAKTPRSSVPEGLAGACIDYIPFLFLFFSLASVISVISQGTGRLRLGSQVSVHRQETSRRMPILRAARIESLPTRASTDPSCTLPASNNGTNEPPQLLTSNRTKGSVKDVAVFSVAWKRN